MDIGRGRQPDSTGAAVSSTTDLERAKWVIKIGEFQREARSQLSGRVVSREEVTALVKQSRTSARDHLPEQ